jgi:PAS domain S-box-containing protein
MRRERYSLLLRFLTTLSPSGVRVIGGGVILMTALIDSLSGYELSIAPLYVLPVGYVTWYDNRRNGVMIAAGAMGVYVVGRFIGLAGMGPLVPLLNGAVLFGVLVVLAWILDFIHRAYLGSLHEAESKYTRIVEAAIEGIVATDAHWHITFVNPRAAKLFDSTTDDLRGKDLLDLCCDADACSALQTHTAGGAGDAGPSEVQFRKKAGGAFWALVTFTPTRAMDGTHEGQVLLMTDISELKRSEQELDSRYREISAMQQIASGLSQSLDLSTRLENGVDIVLGLTGFDAGGIYLVDDNQSELVLQFHRGLLSTEFITRASRWRIGRGVTGQVAATGVPCFIEDALHHPSFDRQIQMLEGVHGFASIPLVSKEKVLGVMSILRRQPFVFTPAEQLMLQTLGKQIGISLENSRLYEMARQSEQQIRQLSIDLVQVQEEERRRFARELHDGLSQLLTTLKINSELALKHAGDDPATAQKHLREVIALAGEAQTEAKQIAYDLRPAILDDFGLKAAIGVHVTSFERRTGIGVDLHMPLDEERFESLVETTIYRIVQELLTNVAKHAAAKRVTIQLLRRGEVLALAVADNGKGFDVKQGLVRHLNQGNYGLRNIRERVEFFGGMFRVESVPGQGSEIMIELPLRDRPVAVFRKEVAS